MLAHQSRIALLRQSLSKKVDSKILEEALETHGRCLEIQQGVRIGERYFKSEAYGQYILRAGSQALRCDPLKESIARY
jgi:hypothetical protein